MRLICNHIYENDGLEKRYRLCTNKQRRFIKETNSIKTEEIPVHIDESLLMDVLGDFFSKEEKIYIKLAIEHADAM